MKSLLALLLLVLIMSSCKDTQVTHAVKAGFKNMFSSGVDTKGSNQAFNDLRKKTTSFNQETHAHKSATTGEMITCEYPNSLHLINTGDLTSISNIKNALCSCSPWGTCGPKSCDCSLTCPENFKIFDRPSISDGTDPLNHFGISNQNNDYNELYINDRNSKGYCWGIALAEQKFQRLASFQSSKPPLFTGRTNERERRQYYQSIIDKVMNNQPVDIPGFKGLTEFTFNSEVRELLYPVLKKEWSSNAITKQGASIILSSARRSKTEYTLTMNDLKYRTEQKLSTVITFNTVGNARNAHSVLVNKIIDNPDGTRKACTIDSNFEYRSNSVCENYFLLEKNGTMNYHSGYKLVAPVGQFQIGEAEDANAVEQLKNLVEKCRSEKGCLG